MPRNDQITTMSCWQSVPPVLFLLVLGTVLLAGGVQGKRSRRHVGGPGGGAQSGSCSPAADGAAVSKLFPSDHAAVEGAPADQLVTRLTDVDGVSSLLPDAVWWGVASFLQKERFFLHNIFDALVPGRSRSIWAEQLERGPSPPWRNGSREATDYGDAGATMSEMRKEMKASWDAFFKLLRQDPHLLNLPIGGLSKLNRRLRRQHVKMQGTSSIVQGGHPYGLAAQLACYGANGINTCRDHADVAEVLKAADLDAPLRYFLKLVEDELTRQGMQERENRVVGDNVFYDTGLSCAASVQIASASSVNIQMDDSHRETHAPEFGRLIIRVNHVKLSEEDKAQLQSLERTTTLSNGLVVFAESRGIRQDLVTLSLVIAPEGGPMYLVKLRATPILSYLLTAC
ncbi:unnamed protein product [Amoebophrya sp. A25]|nr:unnamed protein product [Amoebophrya sp. A25]|eukprot:GSA25T00023128001.1